MPLYAGSPPSGTIPVITKAGCVPPTSHLITVDDVEQVKHDGPVHVVANDLRRGEAGDVTQTEDEAGPRPQSILRTSFLRLNKHL